MANGPCRNKTGGRTDPGRMAIWANGFGGENFLGEQIAIRALVDPHYHLPYSYTKVLYYCILYSRE